MELGLGVGEGDIELLGSLDDGGSLALAEAFGQLSLVGAVVHQQNLQLGCVGHQEGLESVLVEVASGSGVPAADGWHGDGASEATSDSAVNTDGFAPAGLRG